MKNLYKLLLSFLLSISVQPPAYCIEADEVKFVVNTGPSELSCNNLIFTVIFSDPSQVCSSFGNYTVTVHFFSNPNFIEHSGIKSETLSPNMNWTQPIASKVIHFDDTYHQVYYFVEVYISNLDKILVIDHGPGTIHLQNNFTSCSSYANTPIALDPRPNSSTCVSFKANFGGYNPSNITINNCYQRNLVDVTFPQMLNYFGYSISGEVPVFSRVDVGKNLEYTFGNLPTTMSSLYYYRARYFSLSTECGPSINVISPFSSKISATLAGSANGWAGYDQDYSSNCKGTDGGIQVEANPLFPGQWTVVSPTGCGAYFDDPTKSKTTFHAGTCSSSISEYTLRWTTSAGCYDDVNINYGFVCSNNDYVDQHGEHYPTINLGGRCWMAKNLNYSPNPSHTNNTQFDIFNFIYPSDTRVKYCYQNETNGHPCSETGGFYLNSYAQSACEDCWELPLLQDWAALFSDPKSENLYKLVEESNPRSVFPSGFNLKLTGELDPHLYNPLDARGNLIRDFSFWNGTDAQFWNKTEGYSDYDYMIRFSFDRFKIGTQSLYDNFGAWRTSDPSKKDKVFTANIRCVRKQN